MSKSSGIKDLCEKHGCCESRPKSQTDILETKNNMRVYIFILLKQSFNLLCVFSCYLTYIPVQQIHV